MAFERSSPFSPRSGAERFLARLGLAMLALALLAAPAATPFAQTPEAPASGPDVDVALVLAVDISYSMDPEELALQRQGYVEALRSPAFHEAVRKGLIGRIALTYFEWAGTSTQRVLVPWTLIDGPESAAEVAARIEQASIHRAYRTSISGAIDKAVELMDASGVRPLRKVVDISGDGPNNQGRSVTAARDAAVAKGLILNGLPVVLKRGGYYDMDNLDHYYEDCVIGGPGSFMIAIREREQFAAAIRTKLILEVSGVQPDAAPMPARHAQAPGRSHSVSQTIPWPSGLAADLPVVWAGFTALEGAQPAPAPSLLGQAIPAQAGGRARVPCAAGERQWQERMGN